MSNSTKNLILFFVKILSPIIFIVFITYLIFLNKIDDEKKSLMYEQVQSTADLISAIYQFDSKYSVEIDFDLVHDNATLWQIQKTFNNLKNSNNSFTYFLGKKSSEYIEYIAYSTNKQPPPVKLSDINKAQPMRDALNSRSGIKIKKNHLGMDVFSAYTPIRGTPWGLVVEQPYTKYIEFFYTTMGYMIISSVIVFLFLFYILWYYEHKNSALVKKSEDRFKHLIESTYDWIWEVDVNGVYTYASHQIESILGYKPSEVIGKTPCAFMREEESKRIRNLFMEILKNREPIINLENINIHKNGEEITLLTSGTPFFNSMGSLIGYRGIDKDITDDKKQIKRMEQLAYFDSLTALANRKNITDRIEEEVHFSRRNNTKSALIFLDLDGFKHINDSLGHDYGDEVLVIISSRLKKCIREFDVVGRFGGDEFVMLLRGKEKDCERCKEYISILIDRIMKSINQPIELNNAFYTIGASLGVAFIPEDGENAIDIIKHADSAMYKAKELGKNRAIFYDVSLQKEADNILHIKSEILSAFENKEFIMYYQAQYDADGENILSYEALVRWEHKTKGILIPEKFMPYISKFGLWLIMDKYVCNKVYEDLYGVVALNIKISINISAKSFEDENFINFVKDKIDNHGVDSSRITLEITEDALINIANNSYIDKIVDLGFKISIDDFGTGYSNLSYLSNIKYDEIKIDKSFIQGAVNNSKDEKICKLILSMCSELNVKVVAEGVETQEQLDFIRNIGIDVIQGYFYARPKPLKELSLSKE